jgi:choice-of-anchor A domain-containing protein/uncharacterized repeat protein (TIGR01451 family)
MKNSITVLLITMIMMATSLSNSAVYAADANDILSKWNAIVTKDVTNIGEIEGRMFIGGNYNVSNSHQFGFKLTGNTASDVVFAVGGTVTTNGQANIKVFNGSAAVATSVSSSNWFQFMQSGGNLSASSSWPANNSPISDIKSASAYWKTLTANSTISAPSSQPGPLKFNCASGQSVAVFSVTDAETFENSKVQQIELNPANETQTVIINVKSIDGSVNWSYGNMVGLFNNNDWRSRVIWNFYTDANGGEMGDLNFNSGFGGALIAPTAKLNTNSNCDGVVVVEYLNTSAEIHLTGWNGSAPVQQTTCYNKIGSYVYHDSNVNGTKDSGETGIANVAVELLKGSSTVATATTAADGSYNFTNLTNGTYKVQLAASNFANGGVFYNTSSTKWYTRGSKSQTITLNCNDNLSVNFGYYKTNVKITKAADKATAKPGDFITYTFTLDNGGDVVLHGGVDVKDPLVKLDTNFVQQPGTSSTFTRKYKVKDTDCGSLVNIAYAEGHPVLDYGTASAKNLDYITDYDTVTVVINCKATLGDKVWLDTNKNGIQDNGENGLSNATVKLYTCAGALTASTTTDSSGNYLFTNLNPGSYYVEFTKPNGYLFTTKDANSGNSDNTDSDADASTGKTVCIDLSAGETDLTWDAGLYAEQVIQKADLKIEKSSNNANPSCGDNVVYTIKVTNLGPNTATNVVSGDVLPAGLLYVSSSASVGSYDNTTGMWNIGSLADKADATLTVTAKVDCSSLNSTSFDLGAAQNYNLFILEDLNQPSSDTQGKVAVGKDANLSNYSVGDQLAAGNEDVLIVGHDLKYTSGRVYNGNVIYGNSSNLPQTSVSIDGTLSQGNPIDFAAAKAYLEGLTASLSNYTVSGTTTFEWGGLKLTGNDPFLNVFNVKGSDLNSANDFQISVPNGAVVLVNIDGTNVTWSGGLVVNGTAISNVLFNFPKAISLTISGIDIRGTILAPFASLNFASGVINGQVIAKSMTGSGQFNLSMFKGNIPVDKVITNIASVSSKTTDEVSTNNSSSATITIGSTASSSDTTSSTSGGGNSSSDTTGTWKNVCSFSDGQIVYALLYDGTSIYAGTMGGKIYESKDKGTTWTLINSSMNVGFIWSIAKKDNYLYAGTENGVYVFDGSAWKLTSLCNKDVHALVVKGNDIYAGTWGYGIYKTSNNGTDWTEVNDGLDWALTIQSLTVYNGSLYAGTVGGGLFKSADGKGWSKAGCGKQIIWTIGATSSCMFAGTYGDGLYKSTDGTSFTKVSTLSVPYIYNVMTDASDRIFVSSLTNGVFVSTDNGNTWSALGMKGFNISSLLVNKSTSEVYAGTKSGAVYKMSSIESVTSVGEAAAKPTTFSLSQNYPNPFNPSTIIGFSVPAAGRYSLKVYDILGQEVATLLDQEMNEGTYKVTFNAANIAGGVYVYRLSGNNVNIAKKMMLVK